VLFNTRDYAEAQITGCMQSDQGGRKVELENLGILYGDYIGIKGRSSKVWISVISVKHHKKRNVGGDVRGKVWGMLDKGDG